MQGITPPTVAQLLAAGQDPFMKFEIYVAPAWVELNALDAKHYVESISVSLGGASPTPNPIGGKWSASLSNDLSIFHHDHPTSAYKGYCVTGREIRISIGAIYGGVPYLWQRLIGYMGEPKFNAPDYKVSISGQDYMKRLEDIEFQELDATYPNHWGSSATFDSWPSDGLLGIELYNEADAMDITGEVDNVNNWTPANCAFVSVNDVGGGSTYVGRMTISAAADFPAVKNPDVGTAVLDKKYKVTFKYIRESGSSISVSIFQNIIGADVRLGIRGGLSSTTWKEESIYFTAEKNGAIEMWITSDDLSNGVFKIDQISIWEYLPEEERYYDLTGADVNQKGPYHVTYDDGGGAVPVQQGEEDEGWYYEEATGYVFFDRNKTVVDGAGLNNITVYYYLATDPEDAVARILWFAGLGYLGTPFANEGAALAAMDNDDPGFAIDKVWFEAGTTFLSAIKMLCEVCNYRFHFSYAGQPVFKAPPAGAVVFTFSSPLQIESQRTYQSEGEIKNRIIIKGIKQAEPINREDTVPSELVGEANNPASIGTYGERTMTITNHLFQTQARIDAMCATLLALYKDPNWYADLSIPFNPVPLELGDKIQWEERLSPTLDVTQTGIIRDIKISNFGTTYKVVKT